MMSRRQNGIAQISLRNFKGCADMETAIKIRPITLLFGANSAGKSTILHAIHYAWSVLTGRQADIDRSTKGGDMISLGGYRELVHRHEVDRSISVGVDVWVNDDALEGADPELMANLKTDECNVSGLIDVESVGIRLTTSWDRPAMKPWVESYTVRINGTDVASIVSDGIGKPPEISGVNWEHPLFRSLIDSASVYDGAPDQFDPVNKHGIRVPANFWNGTNNNIDDYYGGIRNDLWTQLHQNCKVAGRSSLTGLESVIPDFNGTLPHLPETTIAKGPGPSESQSDVLVAVIFRSVFGQCFLGIGRRVLAELQRFRYVGPLRVVPSRDSAQLSVLDDGRWADGSAAWDFIFQHFNGRTGRGDDVVRHISSVMSREESAGEVGLGLGYGIEVVETRLIETGGPFFQRLQAMSMNALDIEERDLLDLIQNDFMKAPARHRIVLVDPQGLRLSAHDVGVGVAQVVPVVVAAMAPHANTIAVEQPELHIHPAIQVALGDLFIQHARQDDKVFLLETHSEHIVLRLLRRIRETASGELTNPDLDLTPEDVAFLYLTAGPTGLKVTELPVDAEGEFLVRWPNKKGFFGERLDEVG